MADQGMEADELVPDKILNGEQLFEAAIDVVCKEARRELRIFDKDLANGGYASIKRYEILKDFLAGQRRGRLIILLHDPSHLTGRCPRLLELARIYSHSMTIHQTGDEAQTAQDSFVIADDTHYLHRFHIDHARFRYRLDDPGAVQPLRERFDQIMETSTHSVSTTTLGL